jgi:hypothetical protein
VSVCYINVSHANVYLCNMCITKIDYLNLHGYQRDFKSLDIV